MKMRTESDEERPAKKDKNNKKKPRNKKEEQKKEIKIGNGERGAKGEMRKKKRRVGEEGRGEGVGGPKWPTPAVPRVNEFPIRDFKMHSGPHINRELLIS